jgi:hypothetical protein
MPLSPSPCFLNSFPIRFICLFYRHSRPRFHCPCRLLWISLGKDILKYHVIAKALNTYEQRTDSFEHFSRGPRPLWTQFYVPTYINTYILLYILLLLGKMQQSGTRGLRPLLAQAALTLCLPVAWEQHRHCSLPFMFVFGDSSQADERLLDPGTGGGLGSWRVLTEVSSSMSLMTSWHMGERLTSCGLGSEQRRLNRRILLKHINEDDIAS